MYYPIFVNPQNGKVSLVSSDDYSIEVIPRRPSGEDSRWTWSKELLEKNKHLIVGKKINRQNNDNKEACDIFRKDYLEKEYGITLKKPRSIWDEKEVNNQNGRASVKELFDGLDLFDFPKSPFLSKKIVSSFNDDDFVIMDFFGGSGTSAQSILELNKEDGGHRKFIMIQLPEICDEKSEAFKAGYKTISDLAKERIRRVISKISEEKETLGKETANLMEKVAELQQQIEELQKNENPKLFAEGKQSPEIEKLIKQQEVARDKANENIEKMDKIDQCDKGFKVLKLNDSNFKQWLQINGKDAKALEEQMKLFIDPVAENATIENMVYELLLKSGKDLNCKIEQATNYFKINENELIFMLEKATQDIVDSVLKEKPLKVVALDKLFKGNDQLKTNTVLQMKDAGIEFKTI